MNRAYLRKVASITGISLASLTQSLDARQLVLPPTELIEAHKPELVKPDGTPLFGPSREQVMMAMGIMPGASMGFMTQGDTALLPANVFKVNLRTGTGSATSISGLPFAPDLYIGKGRSTTSDWGWYDTTRGATFSLNSATQNAQSTQAQGITAFNSGGVSIGTLSGLNTNAATYIDLLFKKSARFHDQASWSGNGTAGRTITHSLGVVPGMIIVKCTNNATGVTDWWVYHRGSDVTSPQNYYIKLNGETPRDNNSNAWNNTAPTSSVFSLGSGTFTNTTSNDYIAYLFAHDPTGIIQCGSYTGNGSTTGPIITLGWDPQWVMIKRIDGTGSWNFWDTTRTPTFTGNDNWMRLNETGLEQLGAINVLDVTGTGFQIKHADSMWNTNTGTYAYMAIKA